MASSLFQAAPIRWTFGYPQRITASIGVLLFMAGAEGIEPATSGFGDQRSTNWATPLSFWWEKMDSNQRSPKASDLQSDGFDRLPILPKLA